MNFCTLYPEGNKGDLFRDPGQIPYNLAKCFSNVNSMLVACNIPEDNCLPEIKRFRTQKIDKLMNNYFLTGIMYLVRNAKKIDCLNLYHCRRQTLIFSRIYKLLNRKGKVYVKLDASFQTLEKLRNDRAYLNVFLKLCSATDVISAEANTVIEGLNALGDKRIENIPNGAFLEEVDDNIVKEKIFLTVARVGAPEKNDNILMEAFAKIANQCDWSLMLVGPIEEKFNSFISGYYEKYPSLRDRVKFTGNIDNRKELATLYQRASVFVLPSAYENFSLACTEAMHNGCYVILSDQVTPYREFTNDFKFGKICKVGSVDDLSDKMLEVSKLDFTEEMANEIATYSGDNFTWDKICIKLYSVLMNNYK